MTYITFRWQCGPYHCCRPSRHVGRPSRSMGEHYGRASTIGRVKALSAVMGVAAAVTMSATCFTHGSDVTGISCGAYRRSAVGHGDAVNGTEGAGNLLRPADPHRYTVCGESHLALLTSRLAAHSAQRIGRPALRVQCGGTAFWTRLRAVRRAMRMYSSLRPRRRSVGALMDNAAIARWSR